ncbi:MAG: tetratricopeptide repeat protein [Clostridia bacterium]|nr:tetratricopeptide repeat protein [Clostridia bacterium]
MEHLMSNSKFKKPNITGENRIQKVAEDPRKKELATPDQIRKNSWSVRTGVKRKILRPKEEYDIQYREDRVGRYFKKYLSKFVFAEFSDEYLKKGDMQELMKGVPIPLRKEDLSDFAGGSGLKPTHLAENMAWIMGIDPHFQYTAHYVEFLKKIFNYKIGEGMLKNGRDAAEKGEYDEACIHFRAALCMNPEYLHGMYSYARCCREMYLNSNNEEYIGRFKAESLEYFELTTEAHPRHAQSYYYLGYAYLNIGLYTKAQLAWKQFLNFTRNFKDRQEISKRLKQLEDPVRIEQAINWISTGRYDQGIPVLESYRKSEFDKWWPLHYYLGVAYARTGRRKDAIPAFKRTLEKNGSHIESMRELAEIYQETGDREEEQKFRKKIALVEESMAAKEEYLEKKRNQPETPTENYMKRASKEPIDKKKTGIKRLK